MKSMKLMILALMMGSATWASNTPSKTSVKSEKPVIVETSTPYLVAPEKIYFYPSASVSNQIFIQSIDQYQMHLSDMEGQLVLQKSNTNYLDVSSLNNGIYILDYKDSRGNKQQRIITIKK